MPGAADRHAESPVVRLLKVPYRAVLPALSSNPIWAIAVLVAAFGATGYAMVGLGQEFLPNFQENDFLMHWVEKPGTSLEAMRRLTVRASEDLHGIEGVRNFGSHIGRAEVADEIHDLAPGDTIFFRADVPLSYENRSTREARCLDIITYGRSGG